MIYPRWYQAEAVDALFSYFVVNQGNPVEAMPCGTGKSIVIGGFLYRVFSQYPYQRVMILTHVKELIRQDYDALMRVWPEAPAGIYSSGLNRREMHYPITFGGVASVIKVVDDFGKIDLLLIDEAHLLGPNDDAQYMQIIAVLKAKNPFLKVIGFTATPYRQGMGLLTNGEIFTDICYDLCTPQGYGRLFAENFLVPPNQKACKTEISTAGLRIVNGDYSANQLNEITREEKITWEALNESLNKAPDRTCRLVFCTGIDHAMLAADMCKYLGLRSAAVHSKMPTKDRDDIHAAYRNGELDVLTNNGIYTTGHDNPRIDHIIELRPTASVGLRVQMIGRGMRPFEVNGWRKVDCLVSDHCGNTRNLGPIDDPYIPKMKGKGAGDAPVKICPACDSYNHASARVCAHCGQPFELRIGYKREAWEDNIIKSDLPIIERYDVQHVYYTQYIRKDATADTKPVIKATYQCGLQRYVEFVAIEAMGFAQKKARDWWRQRFGETYVPTTVAEAMTLIDRLIAPKAINVWVNKKYPEIMSYEF
jgi:superfamily II DNA or RNA helicase